MTGLFLVKLYWHCWNLRSNLTSTNNPDDENEVAFSIEIQLEEGDNEGI